MRTAGQYQEKIDQILGISLDQGESYQWDYETIPDAEITLGEIRDSIGNLSDLRRELNADLKRIRDDYRDKMAKAAAGSASAMSLLGKKQKAGQMKADAKRQLRTKRNEELAPYNEVKGILDGIISNLEKQITLAQKFIDSDQGSPADVMTEPERLGAGLATFYLATPPAGSQMALMPMSFSAVKPIEPNEAFVFDQPQPVAPDLKETGLRGLFSSSHRQQIEQENRQLQDAFNEQHQAWSEARDAARERYNQEKEAYQGNLEDWLARKKAFDDAEIERVRQLEAARLNDPATMRALLGRRLDLLLWPAELDMTSACEYNIEKGGGTVQLEVQLPDQLNWPTTPISYGLLVHAIAFRLVGEIFYVLPAANKVLISAFEADSFDPGRRDRVAFYLSSKVTRKDWQRISFEDLGRLDLLGCFDAFETRSKITDSGRLLPIKPIRI